MVNAALAAMEINSMLPQDETPRDTDGYEGFYHLTDMKGDVGHAVLRYIIRDHDAAKFEERKTILRAIEKKINQKWGRGTASLTITDQYRNMAEIISGCMQMCIRDSPSGDASLSQSVAGESYHIRSAGCPGSSSPGSAARVLTGMMPVTTIAVLRTHPCLLYTSRCV